MTPPRPARPLAPATRNGYLNAVRAFLRFLQRTT
jgi:hypothetical protein